MFGNNTNKSFLDELIDLFKNGLSNCLDFKNIDVIEGQKVTENDYKSGPIIFHSRGSCHVFRQHEPERADDINIYDDGKHGVVGGKNKVAACKGGDIEMDGSGGVRI